MKLKFSHLPQVKQALSNELISAINFLEEDFIEASLLDNSITNPGSLTAQLESLTQHPIKLQLLWQSSSTAGLERWVLLHGMVEGSYQPLILAVSHTKDLQIITIIEEMSQLLLGAWIFKQFTISEQFMINGSANARVRTHQFKSKPQAELTICELFLNSYFKLIKN